MRKGMDIRLNTLLLAAVLFLSSCSGASEIWTGKAPSAEDVAVISTNRYLVGLASETAASIEKEGAIVVKNKTLHTGDLFDEDFIKIYPNIGWLSDSVLRITSASQENDLVEVKNLSNSLVGYALIESIGSKFIILHLRPNETVTFRFDFRTKLSIDGELTDPKRIFQAAVATKASNDNRTGRIFHLNILDEQAEIHASGVDLIAATCCGVDRPSS